MRAVVLRGVERRPVVQVVNRGNRPRRVRVSVHGSRHTYSVHPAVVGQLIVLSEPGKGEAGAGGERARRAEGEQGKTQGEESQQRSGKGTEMGERGRKTEGRKGVGEAGERERQRGAADREREIKTQPKSERRKVPSTS